MTSLSLARTCHAAGSDMLRVGLIGCGGRGTGAAVNAMNADKNARLVAMADAFDWRLAASLKQLAAIKPKQVDVDADHKFVGLQSYRSLLESAVDVVIITVPSHFTPIYLKAAVDAGKHVFCEKRTPWTHPVSSRFKRRLTARGGRDSVSFQDWHGATIRVCVRPRNASMMARSAA